MVRKNTKKKVLNDKGYKEFKALPKFDRNHGFSIFDIEQDLTDLKADLKTTINESDVLFKQYGKVGSDASEITKETKKNQKTKEVKEVKDVNITVKDKTIKKMMGAVDGFDKYVDVYEKNKSDFITISYGATRKIICGKKQLLFSGFKKEKKPKGLHLIGMVRRDINVLLDGVFNEATGQYDGKLDIDKLPKIPNKKPSLTYISNKNIDWYGTGIQALAIDINHCHWRTIFLLGYITQATYLKGLECNDWKSGRLIAIGTLGKILTVRKYVNGVKIEEYTDDREYLRYGGFYWAVISKVNLLMVELVAVLKEDFLMFLTDCVVCDPARKLEVIEIMAKHGYNAKEYFLAFTELSDSKVAWICDSGENKRMKRGW